MQKNQLWQTLLNQTFDHLKNVTLYQLDICSLDLDCHKTLGNVHSIFCKSGNSSNWYIFTLPLTYRLQNFEFFFAGYFFLVLILGFLTLEWRRTLQNTRQSRIKTLWPMVDYLGVAT